MSKPIESAIVFALATCFVAGSAWATTPHFYGCSTEVEKSEFLDCVELELSDPDVPECTQDVVITNSCDHEVVIIERDCQGNACIEATLASGDETSFSLESARVIDEPDGFILDLTGDDLEGTIEVTMHWIDDRVQAGETDSSCSMSGSAASPSGIPLLLLGALGLVAVGRRRGDLRLYRGAPR